MHAFCIRPSWGSARVATTIGILKRLCRQSSIFSNVFSPLNKQPVDWTNVRVDCGVSGHIVIDLFNRHLLHDDPSAPLVVYLPPSGTCHSQHHPPIPSYLLSSSTVLARINYRWNIPSAYSLGASDNHPFPVPLHDTIRAWSHITETLLSSYQSFDSSVTPTAQTCGLDTSSLPVKLGYPIQRPVFIYGTFLGGTLATSLALTENYVMRERPFRIHGLIAKNAVFDWVSIVTDAFSRSISRASHEPLQNTQFTWNESNLLRLRKKLFTNPKRCFDAFASPILFFRTAGVPPPSDWNQKVESSSSSSESESRRTKSPQDEDRPNSRYWFGFENFNPPMLRYPYKNTNFDLAYKRAYLFFPQTSPLLEIPRALILSSNKESKSPKQDSAEKTKDFQKTSKEINPTRQAEIMVNLMKRQLGFKIDFDNRRVNNGDIQLYEIDDDYETECRIVKKWMAAPSK